MMIQSCLLFALLCGIAGVVADSTVRPTAAPSVGPQEYLVMTTRSGLTCEGDRQAYIRYTLNACMLITATVDGYLVESGKFAAHELTNGEIWLRLHVYTDDSCNDYLDTVDYSSSSSAVRFPSVCYAEQSPTPSPTISYQPTASPSTIPTRNPSASPSTLPTIAPTAVPTHAPSVVHTGPTVRPTHEPTTKPSSSLHPSPPPTARPTVSPTRSPSFNLDKSFTDWDDQITSARLPGQHSVFAEITTDATVPSETGFFTRMGLYTNHCEDESNIYMYHWTSDTDTVTAKCKSKANILFSTYRNGTALITSMKATVSAGSTGDDDFPLGSDDVRHCFAGTEMVQMADGSSSAIADLKIGDEILSADRSGNLKFSPVIAIPHPKSASSSQFVHISTKSGKDIKMTSEHLVACEATCQKAASPSLLQASAVQPGMCLYSVDHGTYQMDEVVAVSLDKGHGAFTVVPEGEMIVVNGFLASPFAFNHAANTAYYNVWRFLYSLSPSLSSPKWLTSANELFGALSVSVWRN
jgi:hypothetical protein